jgi:SAM-dependent methyltransferase
MSSSTQDDNKALGFEVDGFDWKQYISHRPTYPPSFYEKIYAHHAALNGNVFEVAHDVGAGPGIVAQQLASKFDKVIVSDPNSSYLNVAKHRLYSDTSSKFEFLTERAEESSVASGTVDLVVISMSIHWTDVTAAVNEFARQLKRGGTLYIVNYAFCTILDNPKADALLRDIVMDYVDQFQEKPAEAKAIINRALKTLSCGFDNVGFDEQVWEGIRRVFVNGEGDNRKLEPPARFKVDTGAVEIGENEERVFEEGAEAWFMEGCNLEWFKQAFASFEFGGKVDDSKKKWMELEDILGGKDQKWRVVWPSVHIFATKR